MLKCLHVYFLLSAAFEHRKRRT